MNKTRKKIIDIIEPFMDKTLSEGVLFIENKRKAKYADMINASIDWPQKATFIWAWLNSDFREQEIRFVDNFWCNAIAKNKIKIIWHYDITAVLKYIDNNWYVNYNNLIDKIIVEKFPEWREVVPFYVGEISKKPLNLFSDLEEKDLLDLLLKL